MKFQASAKHDQHNGTSRAHRCTFMIMPCSFLVRIRNVSHKSATKIKTQILCSVSFFFVENRAVFEVMWKNTAEQDSPQMTIWRMRVVCWIPKGTDTHSECVMLEVWREKNQQDAANRCLLLTSISTCFGHHYAHLQENKEPVTAFGVLFWFCWMGLVAVVGRCLKPIRCNN